MNSEKIIYFASAIEPFWSDEELVIMHNYLNTYFREYLLEKNEFFSINSGLGKGHLEIEIVLKSKDDSFYYPIQLIYFTDLSKEALVGISTSLFDYCVAYWRDYFSDDRDVFLPIDWHPSSINGIEFLIRGAFRNLNAERLADELLEKHGHGEYEILPIGMDT